MGQIFDSKTFRLFKDRGINSSVIDSVSDMFDFSTPDLYNYNKDEKEADRNSLRDDWMQVGKDLKNSIDEYASPTK